MNEIIVVASQWVDPYLDSFDKSAIKSSGSGNATAANIILATGTARIAWNDLNIRQYLPAAITLRFGMCSMRGSIRISDLNVKSVAIGTAYTLRAEVKVTILLTWIGATACSDLKVVSASIADQVWGVRRIQLAISMQSLLYTPSWEKSNLMALHARDKYPSNSRSVSLRDRTILANVIVALEITAVVFLSLRRRDSCSTEVTWNMISWTMSSWKRTRHQVHLMTLCAS